MVSDNSKMSFSELYDTYSRLVMVIALRVLEEKELAEDAFQSAFISPYAIGYSGLHKAAHNYVSVFSEHGNISLPVCPPRIGIVYDHTLPL